MEKHVKKAEALLELERKIVGVKIADTEEEYSKFSGVEAVAPISYCVAVKSATLGHAIKFKAENSGCGGSTRALGLMQPSQGFYNGRDGYNLGLYCSEEAAAKVSERMKLCEHSYGIIVKPLELFEKEPDVVLIIANSRTCMRILQGYTYYYGMQDKFCMTGNQALCVEATAVPVVTGDINVSMLCSGTRFLAQWKDYEIAVGIPFRKFVRTVEGIHMTVNAVESDERKEMIAEGLEKLGYAREEIHFGETYYLKLEREKRKRRGTRI